ncbi:MAG: hypothetical protein WEA76_08430 [Acidimicrobiia bacterium]
MTEPAVKTGGGVRSLLAAGWGAVTGIAPHVLHHVGPLAGAALLAGASGQLAFFAVGLVATMPTLRRLHRRFDNWLAPGLALGVFGVAFAISTFVVGPLLTTDEPAAPVTAAVDHDAHGH